ncbi:hypothetical protein NFX31_12900 [Microbacterium azadirachtae]|uniref:hypothetical protein n=1 Tax=Microbacterium azadirachtae TaxID=582680 RepID=UPI0021D500B5|nr:hypothetical protein [Microbacterium azadirachtae]UXW85108.1 hypothetical protein NFX31_12900 [Microbacterium azadirachtae]
MSTNTQHVAAVKKYQADVAAAVRWTNPDYTNSGITRERARRVAQARKALAAAIPAKPERKGGDPRESVIAGLAPKTADEIAQIQHAWAKVEKRLDAGQSLHAILTSADRDTLAAILDGISTRPEVLSAGDGGASIVAEVQQVAYDRLLELGDPEATKAHDSVALLDQAEAWSDYIAALAEPGEPSLAVLSALQRADQEGFTEVQSGSPLEGVETQERLRSLDHLVATGSLQVEGV